MGGAMKTYKTLAQAIACLTLLGACSKTLIYTTPQTPALSGSAGHGWLSQKSDAGYFMIEASVKETRECSFQGSKLFPEQTDIMIAVTPTNVGSYSSDEAIPVYHKRVYGDQQCRIHQSDVLLLPLQPLRAGTSGTLKLEVVARNTKDENVSQYLFSAATFAVAALPVVGVGTPAILATLTTTENSDFVKKFNEEYKKSRDARMITEFPVNIGSSDLEAGKTSFSIPIYAVDTGTDNMETAIANEKLKPSADRRIAFTIDFTIRYRKSVFADNSIIVNTGSYYRPDVGNINHRDVLKYTGASAASPTLYQRLNRDLPSELLKLQTSEGVILGNACTAILGMIEKFGLSRDDEAIVYYSVLREVAGEWYKIPRFTTNPGCFARSPGSQLDIGNRLVNLYGGNLFVGAPPSAHNSDAVVNGDPDWLKKIGHPFLPHVNRALLVNNTLNEEQTKAALAALSSPNSFSIYIEDTGTSHAAQQGLADLAAIKLTAVGCNIQLDALQGRFEALLGLRPDGQVRLFMFQLENPDQQQGGYRITRMQVYKVGEWRNAFLNSSWDSTSVCMTRILPVLRTAGS
jgi:hypothetical protein